MKPPEQPDLLLAITGASGSLYGVRLLDKAAPLVRKIHLILSERGKEVMATELGLSLGAGTPSPEAVVGRELANVRVFAPDDFTAPCASGSGAARAMVIAPCSMDMVARVATGLGDDLISRAAGVMLKERRKLILVPRETPLSLIHLRNLTTVAEAGATVMPACPGFYHRPRSVDDLVDFVVERILDHLDLPGEQKRWGI